MLSLPAPGTGEDPGTVGCPGTTAPRSPYSPGSMSPRTRKGPRRREGPRSGPSRKRFDLIWLALGGIQACEICFKMRRYLYLRTAIE